jgi:hypothetical protein
MSRGCKKTLPLAAEFSTDSPNILLRILYTRGIMPRRNQNELRPSNDVMVGCRQAAEAARKARHPRSQSKTTLIPLTEEPE